MQSLPAEVRSEPRRNSFAKWLADVWFCVATVSAALFVTLRNWFSTYRRGRRTFTERYEYPELPVVLAPRFRGFHRYDITSCIACGRCAKDCPVGCIYIGRERREGQKGFRVTSYIIDYTKCLFCGICTENCPVDCIFMGQTYDLSCYSRDGCIVDFAKLPPEIAWGAASLNPTAVALSKLVTSAVDPGPVD